MGLAIHRLYCGPFGLMLTNLVHILGHFGHCYMWPDAQETDWAKGEKLWFNSSNIWQSKVDYVLRPGEGGH